MSSVAGVSVEEYLSTSYRPDCDYVDGEVRERNVGEYPHSNLQSRLIIWFGNRERDWKIRMLPEQRIRVSAHRFRIPDACVLRTSYSAAHTPDQIDRALAIFERVGRALSIIDAAA